jgi:hypothetical protein
MMIPAVMLPAVHAADVQGHDFVPALGMRTIDKFGYRLSFQLEDGVELLLMRATFRVTYTYSQETIGGSLYYSKHIMYLLVGFYYGRTMLGRPVVRDVLADYVAFYPKWHDSAGFPHDLLSIHPMFMLNDTIRDSQLVVTTSVLDDDAVTTHIAEFGGTFVFSGLKFMMDDGSEILLSEEDIQVRVEKYNNEADPSTSVLQNTDAMTYTSDANYLIATLDGTAPWFVAFDAAVVVIFWGSFLIVMALGVLHIKGRIRLPLHKLRGILVSKDVSS